MAKKINRIGERRIMNCNKWCEIIEYNNANDVIVRFDSGFETKCQYHQFKIGNIKDKFASTVCSKGIIGDEVTIDNYGNQLPSYKCWYSMIHRCYDKHLKRDKSYINCEVCEEWLHYSNFKKWYDKNYYEIERENMCLDKDILIKGNKIYSPNTCIFVPNRINVLFAKSDSTRGKLPIGVSKYNNKYKSYILIDGKQKHLGVYDNKIDAFNSYKIAKENEIKRIADYYKENIPNKLYLAMYNWKVEIDD